MVFKVVGYLDEIYFEKNFDCPKKLEMAMQDIDEDKEVGVFKNGFVDILTKGELVRRYEWF